MRDSAGAWLGRVSPVKGACLSKVLADGVADLKVASSLWTLVGHRLVLQHCVHVDLY